MVGQRSEFPASFMNPTDLSGKSRVGLSAECLGKTFQIQEA